VPDGAITPVKLGAGGATPGQVLTASGTDVAFQDLPKQRVTERRTDFKVPPVGKAQTAIFETSCEPGGTVVGGGFSSFEGRVYASAPFNPRWIVNAEYFQGHDIDLSVYVICLAP
jgi:hypothetical protein